MRTILIIIGVIFAVLGVIWFLQGIDVLPGSFMTGDVHWAVYGGITFIVGVILIGVANQRKGGRPKNIV